MTAEWYLLSSDNRSDGPYSAEVVAAWLRHGHVPPTALVRRLDGPWLAASQAMAMLSGAPVPPPLPGPTLGNPPMAVPPPLPGMATVPSAQYPAQYPAPHATGAVWGAAQGVNVPQASAAYAPPAASPALSATGSYSQGSSSPRAVAAPRSVHPLVTLVSIVLGGLAAVALYAKYGHYFRPPTPAVETAPAEPENRRDLISPPGK